MHLKPLALMALFENEFSIDWILEISGLKVTKILEIVESNIQKGQLEKRRPGVYCFKHEDKRCDISALLSIEEKEKYHRSIAGIFFREIADRDDAVLAAAVHLLHLTNDEKGCRQLLRAGDAYRKSYRHRKALQCYRKIIADQEHIESEEADNLYYSAVLAYSKIVELGTEFQEVIRPLKKALVKSRRQGNKKQMALLEMHLAKSEWYSLNVEEALVHFNRGWDIAQKMDDPALKRSALAFNSFFLYLQGRFQDVIRSYEDVISDIDKYPEGRFPLLSAQVVGISYAFNGQIKRGMGMLNAVFDQCRKIGDDYVGSYVALHIGILLIELGRYDEAILNLETAEEQLIRSSNRILAPITKYYLAWAHYKAGNIQESEKDLRECLDLSETECNYQANMTNWYPELLCVIEWNQYPKIDGISRLNKIEKGLKSKPALIRGVALRYQAMREEQLGIRSDDVINTLLKSEKLLCESGHEIQVARTRMELARHYLFFGEEDKAKEVIRKSSDLLDSFLYDQVPDNLLFLLKDLRSDKNLLEEIMKLSQELVTIRNYQELVRQILATVNQITGAERGAVFLLNPEKTPPEMELRAARNITAEDLSHVDFSTPMKKIKNALETGKADFYLSQTRKKAYPLTSGSVHSFICVPLKLRDVILGALYVDNRIFPSALKESDIRILDFFSAQAAIALDNARVNEKYLKLIQRQEEENRYLKAQESAPGHFVEFIGECAVVRQLLADTEKVAATDATVLILGETGVGKELIAGKIHHKSARYKNAFIRVNCSTFPKTLIASELFGHEKGAFTGADKTRLGWFELADGGTLFLDEIGDIPPEVQVRLLRVLQNKEFERVGGRETLCSDFRLLAATNRDLRKDVESGKFREDLYYRLNVITLNIPPLRERKEDVPKLVEYFLEQCAKKLEKPVGTISDGDMKRLMNYAWPGNVRELENIIERGAILNSGPHIKFPELSGVSASSPDIREVVSLQENERQHIRWTLKLTDGKIYGPSGAAELLEINPNTLVSRMKKLGIQKTV